MIDINDIPIGADNAISRQALVHKWHMDDRHVREQIARLRAEDNGDEYIIVSHSNGRGYYRTNNPDQIRHYINETTNRARNTFKPLKKARRILKEMGTCTHI